MYDVVEFFAAGIPVPKGSAKAFVSKKTGKVSVVQTNAEKQKPWAASIGYSAIQAGISLHDKGIPVAVEITFFIPRPACHFGAGKNAGVLKTSAPKYPTTKPDADKLERTALDALTGVAWNDDSQVVDVTKSKRYCTDNPDGGVCGSLIRIVRL